MFSRSFRMMSYNKFIRNMEEPMCKECIYFMPNDSKDNLGKCLKFGERNIITGVITFDDADSCRKDYTKCCMSAIYFEKKQKLQPQSKQQQLPRQNPNKDLSYYHPSEFMILKDF